jgi:hypothetical protein
MGRASRNKKQRKINTQLLPQSQTQTVQQPAWLKRLTKAGKLAGWTIGLVSTIFGIIASYYSFAPFLTIASAQSLRPSNPFAAKFVISNDGLFSIYETAIRCELSTFVFNNGGIRGYMKDGISISTSDVAYVIERGEKITTGCLFGLFLADSKQKPLIELIEGDISVVAFYKPFFPWWTLRKQFRFTAAQDSEGAITWFPKPVRSEIASK